MVLRALCFQSSAFKPTRALMCHFKCREYSFRVERKPKVRHDKHLKRFAISLDEAGNQESAVLNYEFTVGREINLLSTTVPVQLRGKGIAAHLTKAAMDFVVEENLKARISCWYIKKYVDENPLPEYRERIIS